MKRHIVFCQYKKTKFSRHTSNDTSTIVEIFNLKKCLCLSLSFKSFHFQPIFPLHYLQSYQSTYYPDVQDSNPNIPGEEITIYQ